MPGMAFVGELSRKVTRAFVGVVLEDFPRGNLEVEEIEFILVNLFV